MSVKRYTIQDVARHAKVGVGTVSRVLNDDPKVTKEKRLRVKAVIEELGYQPSFTARSLRTQQSNTIGFIADAVATTPYAVQLIKGAQDAAWKHGKLLLVVDCDGNTTLRDKAFESMTEREVEGIVYAAMFHQEINLPDTFKRSPTVLVDCFDKHAHYSSVVPDEYQGAIAATQTLIEHGHKRIAHITNDALDIQYPAPRLRLEGYKKALKDANIPYDPALTIESNGEALSGYQCAHKLMALPEPPTALFCGTDRVAMGAYEAVKSLSLRIPDDVSVVGFDNQDIIAKHLMPPLSTVALPHYEMGEWSITQLLKQPAEPETITQERLACPFISRASVSMR